MKYLGPLTASLTGSSSSRSSSRTSNNNSFGRLILCFASNVLSANSARFCLSLAGDALSASRLLVGRPEREIEHSVCPWGEQQDASGMWKVPITGGQPRVFFSFFN